MVSLDRTYGVELTQPSRVDSICPDCCWFKGETTIFDKGWIQTQVSYLGDGFRTHLNHMVSLDRGDDDEFLWIQLETNFELCSHYINCIVFTSKTL